MPGFDASSNIEGQVQVMTTAIANRMGCNPISENPRRVAVAFVLSLQAGLLAYSATRHSPTDLEPAFLASGVSHWLLGRFEPYRVNPPLVRMVAALPAVLIGCKTDWARFHDGPGARAEFLLGEDFIKANDSESLFLLYYARWACIPFNLAGSFCAYRWARELYRSDSAGFVALVLYALEPNLLAHGELITPDGACTAFGIVAGYTFWRWLKQFTWPRTLCAGVALGLAELSKMSWLILFALWPLLWLMWSLLDPENDWKLKSRRRNANASVSGFGTQWHTRHNNYTCKYMISSFGHLLIIIVIAVYLINLAYAFDGCCAPLNSNQFVSHTLKGHSGEALGNRFTNSLLGHIPIPLPRQYVLGLDRQKKDFEDFSQKSYLRGEWKHGGWWYYYIYGLLVKVPCGTWALAALIIVVRIRNRTHSFAPLRDELVLLAPAISILILVSSQTKFNIHLRYVFPTLGFGLVFLGQASILAIATKSRATAWMACAFIAYSLASTAFSYPHQLAYFNEIAGGPRNGHNHLRGSSLDWGQDLLYFLRSSEHDGPTCILTSVPYSPGSIGLDQFLVRNTTSSGSIDMNALRSNYSTIAVSRSIEKADEQMAWTHAGRSVVEEGAILSLTSASIPTSSVGYTLTVYRDRSHSGEE